MNLDSKYNPKDSEPKIYASWLKDGRFSSKPSKEKQPFSIVIPPPNVTGILHMGHALNNTIQDVLIRFAKMKGLRACWMPGTDHAGIATQNVVERNLAKQGLKKEDIGREKFQDHLWSWTNDHGSTIIEQLKQLGCACDWDRTRFTMDDGYSEAVKETFITLYDKGLIYRGNYIINWCPRCKTALSDEEAAHKEIDGWLYYIKYPVAKKPATSNQKPEKENIPEYIVVATTRPETMLGDTAVAINPKDARYAWLRGKKILLPIMNREIQVIEDEEIDPEFGTGVVKVTPAHDPVDFMLGKKYDLEFINIMGDDAVLNRNAGEFCGMDRFEARAALLEVLEEKKLIQKKEPYTLSAGHCYRCHTIIEPRLSKQWFVNMKPLAGPAIKAVEDGSVTFHPPRWKKVYLNWMNNIRDWCISRQIWWGHRLPVYYCQDCLRNQKPETNNQKNEEDAKGVIVARDKPLKCPDCGSDKLIQETDVLDTWFSSWLWPFATFGWPKDTADLKFFYPTNTLVTASEILFFWVARMIMAGLEFKGEIPFSDVVIHGTVRDDKGIKMSKSLGNTIDPLEIINKYGADALRFSLMMLASTGSDVYLSDDKFLVGRNFSNKIWNATRFMLNKIKETDIKIDDLEISDLGLMDHWLIDSLNSTISETTRALSEYRINDAAKKIYEFFWHVFCDWYIEIIKFDFDKTRAKISILAILNSIKLLHPIAPFITEEIFSLLKSVVPSIKDESIMNSSWPSELSIKKSEKEIETADMFICLVKDLRNLKIDLGLPPTKKIKAIIVSRDFKDELIENKSWFCRLSGLSDIENSKTLERVLMSNKAFDLDFDLVDFDKKSFLAGLGKKIDKLSILEERVSKMLKNENFLKNAADDIIEKEKENIKTITEQLVRLKRLKDAFK